MRPIRLRETIAMMQGHGVISFLVSASHDEVVYYEARARLPGDTSIVLAVNLGHPTPNSHTGLIYACIKPDLNTLAAGNYEVSIASVAATWSADSEVSNVFTVPLP